MTVNLEVVLLFGGIILTIIGNAFFLGSKIQGIKTEITDMKPRLERVETFFDALIKDRLKKLLDHND